MRIVIYSSTFLPNIGGLENIMSGLANNWVSRGNYVAVYTNTSEDVNIKDVYNYNVVRNPSLLTLFKEVRKADIFVEANISLKTCVIGFLFFRKWIAIHHIPYNHSKNIKGVIKNIFTRVSKNIAVSNYVAKTLYGKSIVIPNFYNPLFRYLSLSRNIQSLLFVGRLVSDKGVLLLLNAIIPVLNTYPNLHLTIAGDGPEKKSLIDFVSEHFLNKHVHFIGSQSPEQLCLLYNQHKIVVVPSTWEEPFGIVVLEALACGAKIVYANAGGLPEAVDKECISFKRGDYLSLKNALLKAIDQTENVTIKNSINLNHLDPFNIDHISNLYLNYFKTILK